MVKDPLKVPECRGACTGSISLTEVLKSENNYVRMQIRKWSYWISLGHKITHWLFCDKCIILQVVNQFYSIDKGHKGN